MGTVIVVDYLTMDEYTLPLDNIDRIETVRDCETYRVFLKTGTIAIDIERDCYDRVVEALSAG